jgi:hypothetical protein
MPEAERPNLTSPPLSVTCNDPADGIVSHFANAPFGIDAFMHDTTSILATIEHRFGLPAIGASDAAVPYLSSVFIARGREGADRGQRRDGLVERSAARGASPWGTMTSAATSAVTSG